MQEVPRQYTGHMYKDGLPYFFRNMPRMRTAGFTGMAVSAQSGALMFFLMKGGLYG